MNSDKSENFVSGILVEPRSGPINDDESQVVWFGDLQWKTVISLATRSVFCNLTALRLREG